jgi:hypothetical protein
LKTERLPAAGLRGERLEASRSGTRGGGPSGPVHGSTATEATRSGAEATTCGSTATEATRSSAEGRNRGRRSRRSTATEAALHGPAAEATTLRGGCLARGRINASRSLHSAMLQRVLAAPVFWYDTTPLGRVVNRFSREVSVIDNDLPQTTGQQ